MIAVLWGALLCPLFFIRQLGLAMLFLGVAGASWAPYTPMETTLLQRLVPAASRCWGGIGCCGEFEFVRASQRAR